MIRGGVGIREGIHWDSGLFGPTLGWDREGLEAWPGLCRMACDDYLP